MSTGTVPPDNPKWIPRSVRRNPLWQKQIRGMFPLAVGMITRTGRVCLGFPRARMGLNTSGLLMMRLNEGGFPGDHSRHGAVSEFDPALPGTPPPGFRADDGSGEQSTGGVFP